MKTCPNCGTPSPDEARFCRNCAAPLAAGPAPGPGPVQGANYGGYQGGYPQGAGYAPGYGAKPASKMPLIIGAIVLVVLIGGGIAAYFLFFAGSGSPSDVVKSFVRLSEKGDVDGTFDLLSKNALKQLHIDRNDKEMMKKIKEEAQKQVAQRKKEDEITQLDTKNEKIDGDKASVDVTVKKGTQEPKTRTVKLIKEDGKWKIDEIPMDIDQ
ncbi:MAG TPA: DUF4878 domain-containing protein [Blastocatellia bacterium]|nr:DUF4878 domain-containing protein [Blastocatellia bacterium]